MIAPRIYILLLSLGLAWQPLFAQTDEESTFPEIGVERPGDLEEPEQSMFQVPEEHVDTYFDTELEDYLVDPQKLLKRRESKDLENFLSYHASDSDVDIHVMLFRGDQEIPADIRIQELPERLFGEGKTALLIIYYLGEPSRGQILFSSHFTDVVSITEQDRMLEQSIEAAEKTSLAADQLREFCERTAIQVAQIEETSDLTSEPALIGEEDEAQSHGESEKDDLLSKIKSYWNDWGVLASVILGGIIVALILQFIVRKRAKYSFPEIGCQPRLGGEHAAGIGAVLKFDSEGDPPSAQKSSSDDSLGGI